MKNYLLLAMLVFTSIISANAAGHVAGANPVNVTCAGLCNATAQGTVTGGTGPFSYAWSTLSGFSSTDTTIINLCPDTYTLTVTDSSDMSTDDYVLTILEPTPIVADLIPNNPSTCGACDGTIFANVSGGTPPYTYQWSNGQFGQQLFQGCEGFYNIYVADANGCVAQNYTQLISTSSLTITLDNQTNLDCITPMGSLTVHATGGTGPYNYYWYPNGETTPSIDSLQEGVYTVSVSETGGLDSCWAFAEYVITNTYNLYASINSTPANCGNTGTATLNAQGANPPFTCLWAPGGQTTQSINNLAPGNYTVTVTDNVGCSILGHVTIENTCINIIEGTIYSDLNQNCVQDNGEPGLEGVTVYSTPAYYYAYTDANGNYTIQTPEMSNTVYASVYNQPYLSPTCPSTGSLTVNFTQQGDVSTGNNFGYWADPNYFDLDLHPGWTSASPGFDKTYWFLYRNNSPTTQNAVVRFIYDPVLTYLSCTQGGVHDLAQHKIEWTYNNLAPGANNWYDWDNRPQAFFNVPSSVSINALLHTDFAMLPIAGDAYPENNVLVVDEPVTGSHDPNAKSVIPEGVGSQGFISTEDSVLLYTIHFQNDGNDTAFTVVLIDTLSANLNPASIVPGAASHPYTFTLSEHGIMTFRFDAIMLPDSNVNEPASHGYINYTVKLKPNLSPGTQIENTAHIFFDFNEAIVTNTTINTIRLESGIEEQGSLQVTVFPNPASNTVTIQSHIAKGGYTLTDVRGKTLLTGKINATKFTLDMSTLSSGVYFISINDANSKVVGKVIKQ